MATIALVNLGLVVFDASYIPFRDLYLRYIPGFTQWYGEQFKGIEPERFTVAYLQEIDALENQVVATGLNSPEVRSQLATLRDLSTAMIDENPFQTAEKSGTLEKIKNRLREQTDVESSKTAFNTFWSPDYLNQAGWNESIEFFNAEVVPLLETNYYRNIGENGHPINDFWRIDRWFIALFAVEFLTRTFYLSRRYKGTSWLEAMIWRWFDVFLLLPFWQWLRVIPVSFRVGQTDIFHLSSLIRRIKRAFVTNFAFELTEIVVVQIIDQAQTLLESGDAARWLLDSNRRYVDLNGVDEVALIAQRLTSVLVDQVLPDIKPELDALLQHSVNRALAQVPLYQGITALPGAKELSDRFTRQLISEISQNTYTALQSSMKDEQGAALTQQVVQKFGSSFQTEIRRQHTIDEIQFLLAALLDEIKVNYVQQLETSDIEQLTAKTQRIYEITQPADRR